MINYIFVARLNEFIYVRYPSTTISMDLYNFTWSLLTRSHCKSNFEGLGGTIDILSIKFCVYKLFWRFCKSLIKSGQLEGQ